MRGVLVSEDILGSLGIWSRCKILLRFGNDYEELSSVYGTGVELSI